MSAADKLEIGNFEAIYRDVVIEASHECDLSYGFYKSCDDRRKVVSFFAEIFSNPTTSHKIAIRNSILFTKLQYWSQYLSAKKGN